MPEADWPSFDWSLTYPEYARAPGWKKDNSARQGAERAAAERGDPEAAQRLLVCLAFDLEQFVRRWACGAQEHGLLVWRCQVVSNAAYADCLRQTVAQRPPGPEAQRFLDRALACLKKALDAGMRVEEWDEDGYRTVTGAFAALIALGKDLGAVAVEVEILPKGRWRNPYSSVSQEEGTSFPKDRIPYHPPPPTPWLPPLRWVVALLALLLIVFLNGVLHVVVPRLSAWRSSSAPADPEYYHAQALGSLERLRRSPGVAGTPDRAALLDRALALARERRHDEARKILEGMKVVALPERESADFNLVTVELFLAGSLPGRRPPRTDGGPVGPAD